MKILKLFVFLVLILFIGGTIYFASKDGNYDIKESRVIKAPSSLLYTTINNYKTWEHWGPWKKEDPTMSFIYSENTSGVGGSYSWDGDFPGKMTTTAVEENKSVHQDLHLVTPGGERDSNVYWNFTPLEDGSTEVSWRTQGKHTLLDKVYFTFAGMDFDSDMRSMYASGLEGLENHVLDAMKMYHITVQGITEHGGGFFIYKTTSASGNTISATMGENYGAIVNYMTRAGINPIGMPFTIYNEMDQDGGVIMSNAIPIQNKVTITNDSTLLCGYMPRTKTFQVTLKGNYTYLGEAWNQAMQHLNEKGLKQTEQKPFEIYTNDPGEFLNPADWVTEIYIPIE